MTTPTDTLAAPAPAGPAARADRRGSVVPPVAMVTTRMMELWRRRGLMIALALVTIGIPTVYLAIRLILHATDPTTYGPAGGYDTYTTMVSLVLYTFGFVMAAALGATAGSADLSEGMFRHLVVTGRSRLAVYLARIPAGLAIIVPMVAVGFTVVCLVCVFAAPTRLVYAGVTVPANLSGAGLEHWAADHPQEVICNFDIRFGPSGPGPGEPGPSTIGPVINALCNGPNGPGGRVVKIGPSGTGSQHVTQAQITSVARLLAHLDYADYARHFLYPPVSLMVDSGLWLALEVAIGFIVALGLGSLIGQRTVAVILMVVLELILTPIFARARIPHLINLQRGVVGLATAHLAPGGLPVLGGGGGGPAGGGGNPALVPETTTVAVCVIVAWLIGWTVLGAWRMVTRDA